MTHIEIFQPAHLPQLTELVNAHLGTLAPGWAMPADYIERHLYRNPGQYVIDPWVVARTTLCAIERQRVVAAAHLLRYGSGPEVHPSHQGVGDVAWFLAWPSAGAAAAAVLAAARDQLAAWGVAEAWAWNAGLPVGPFAGTPDVWPHITAALVAAGYQPERDPGEAVYGGTLDQVAPPAAPPIAGATVRRSVGSFGPRFAAVLDGQEIGRCECIADMTEGGALPALRGWAELTELEVDEQWRNRGIGTWLVQHAVAWIRLAGCDRVIFAVAPDDEARGVDRFYQRCGWRPLVRELKAWQLTLVEAPPCNDLLSGEHDNRSVSEQGLE